MVWNVLHLKLYLLPLNYYDWKVFKWFVKKKSFKKNLRNFLFASFDFAFDTIFFDSLDTRLKRT